VNLRFYRQRLPEEITEASFRRLRGDDQQLRGLVAEFEGRLAGFVNYRLRQSASEPSPPESGVRKGL